MRAVIDTNVVLDLFVFQDKRTHFLHHCLQSRAVQWIATPPMREELRLVLAYPHIANKRQQLNLQSKAVLALFDAWVLLQPEAPKSVYTCKDADDQKFVDLAVSCCAVLVSKDKAVLCMRNRLAKLSVRVMSEFVLDLPDQSALMDMSATTGR